MPIHFFGSLPSLLDPLAGDFFFIVGGKGVLIGSVSEVALDAMTTRVVSGNSIDTVHCIVLNGAMVTYLELSQSKQQVRD